LRKKFGVVGYWLFLFFVGVFGKVGVGSGVFAASLWWDAWLTRFVEHRYFRTKDAAPISSFFGGAGRWGVFQETRAKACAGSVFQLNQS
jgi:hypothetical protein